jgi:RNA polymerase sigma factor (sigma-70 family)
MNALATSLGDDAELFRLHYHRLVRQVQRDAGVPEAVAEDCASFAILQLYRRKPDAPDVTPGWLRVVARHEAYAWHSDNKRFPRVRETRPDGPTLERGVEAVSAAELIESPVDVELAFQAREALRALAGLGERRRVALTLKVAGYSYAEIQQRLGVTYTWVNRHVTEARGKLRRDAQVADEAVDLRR